MSGSAAPSQAPSAAVATGDVDTGVQPAVRVAASCSYCMSSGRCLELEQCCECLSWVCWKCAVLCRSCAFDPRVPGSFPGDYQCLARGPGPWCLHCNGKYARVRGHAFCKLSNAWLYDKEAREVFSE